jgi:drug/metabolite transporter (DMT)-like permease
LPSPVLMDPIIRTFVAGFLGSAAVELVAMDQLFRRKPRLPKLYYLWTFWLVRGLLACMGGALAVYYNIENPIAAVQIGASTSAIIKSLARYQRR